MGPTGQTAETPIRSEKGNFLPGNPHRMLPGRSGNPGGKVRLPYQKTARFMRSRCHVTEKLLAYAYETGIQVPEGKGIPWIDLLVARMFHLAVAGPPAHADRYMRLVLDILGEPDGMQASSGRLGLFFSMDGLPGTDAVKIRAGAVTDGSQSKS